MQNSFVHTVATARKWPGRAAPSSTVASLAGLDPGVEAVRIELSTRWREEQVDAGGLGRLGIGASSRG